ncbi:U3 small nucleolar RNA-associated protein 15 [Basidiobolus ranarum]|uniref:U3 small nucleolar RNA-associated protein 15 n=1 Tax=Basidiobolus ranarum TaxID=34480 RepID=A0ABR2W0N6_9FUNG
MEYKRVAVKKFPRLPNRKTPESRYWRKFKSPILIKEYASVTSINFSPVAPYDFAVTSSARVQVYSSKTHSVKKTISRFKDTAYSGSFRNDGKLIVSGDGTGLVQVFDVNSRAILRTFRGHENPVHVAKFSPNNTHILSASDDKTVRVWDIPSETAVSVFEDHSDYVRAGVVSMDNPNLILSGSYDRTVKLWDLRSNSCAISMNHGEPVEDVLMFPGGGLVVSAGGPNVKIFDLLSGGRVLQTLTNHQKTVTSMCFDGSYSRLLTGSLDHHVKVYNVQDYKVVHSVKYPAPILSIALSPDDTHLVAGMASGLLSVRQRVVKPQESFMMRRAEQFNGGTYQYFVRGKGYNPTQEDFKVETMKRKKLTDYDKYLKAFQYSNALDAVLSKNRNPLIVVSLIEELVHRDGLRSSLQGRDDISLEPIVQFLVKNISHPRYTGLLVDVANVILDMYSVVLGQSPLIDELFQSLNERIKKEINFQKDLMKVIGSLDMLFSKASSKVPNMPANQLNGQ